MEDAGFQVELSASAKRDLSNHIVWLEENRSVVKADAFIDKLTVLMNGISSQPFRWQNESVAGRSLRRAVLEKHWIVLYEVYPNYQRAVILAISGVREDWMNRSILD